MTSLRAVRLASGLLLFALLIAGESAAAESPLVVVEKDGRPVAIDCLGIPTKLLSELIAKHAVTADDVGLSNVLSLRVASEAGKPALPAMAGKYEVIGDALRFTPRFSLKAGMRYEADFFPPPLRDTDSPAHYSLTIDVPAKPAGEPAAVAMVYPSSPVLPENQLRFYLQFNRPMRRGDIYQHIRLLKADDEPVELPFLEIGEELWDTTGQRLTLLIDPGRIKRGLKPREESGPVLEAEQSYTLVVDPAWRDADGVPMKQGLKWKFAVGPPIEQPIDPAEWKIEPPKSGSDQALLVRFARPLDWALVMRTIDVVDAQGQPVAGTVLLADRERVWKLQPDKPWASGKYSLVVDTTLEDLAGNRIGRAFEVDVTGTIEKQVVAETMKLPFTIEP
jgi:hypothetical protein